MYLKFVLRVMLVVAAIVIFSSALGLIASLLDVLLLHEFGYPVWAVIVTAFGVVAGIFVRRLIRSWVEDHGGW